MFLGEMQATGGPLKEGERVLVTAAAGATGHMGVQLALLAGCHVVAVCGSAAKAQRLRDLGVHRVINYREEVQSWSFPFTLSANFYGSVCTTLAADMHDVHLNVSESSGNGGQRSWFVDEHEKWLRVTGCRGGFGSRVSDGDRCGL